MQTHNQDKELTPRAKAFAETGNLTHFFAFTEDDWQSIYEHDRINGTYMTVNVNTERVNNLNNEL